MDSLARLNAFRFFDAAARTGSFTRAAAELHVTQSAVSKQVALLEAWMGEALFVRRHRQIELTEAGHRLATAVAGAFQTIREAVRPDAAERPDPVALHCDADFAWLWLFPRLPAFERAHPRLRLSIFCTVGMSMPPREPYDCAVIWGRGEWRDCRFQPLMTNTVFPVAAPDFFASLGRPPKPQDVVGDMLIHDQSTQWWSAFRAVTAETSFDPRAGRVYNQTHLCLEAAARGDGITIGDEVTTSRYLEEGRLTRPFDERLPTPDSYYVALPQRRRPSEATTTLLDWLHEEASAHSRWWRDYWTAPACGRRAR